MRYSDRARGRDAATDTLSLSLSMIFYCWMGDLDMARRSREEGMRLGKTLFGHFSR